jgi:trigger factor
MKMVQLSYKEIQGGILTMSLQVEKLEKNMAKLTIEVSAEEFEAAIQSAYMKNKGKISIRGFRKGKAPRKMIEKMYGVGVFYEDAANALIPDAYDKEIEGCDLDIVSQPQIDVVQIEAGKPFIFTAEVALKPEVTLGEYKGVEVEKQNVEVTEEEVQAEIDKERENNSRVIDVDDRAVANGDMIKLDFEGFVDGVAFEGGKGEDYDLTIGSGSFIPGFEEQLVGAEIGADVEVNVTFPEEYHSKDLAGKAAVFKCKVNEIKVKELPEADDDFAQDVSEFDTLAEYKEDIKKNLTEKKEQEAKSAKEMAVVEKIVENATMEIPDPMVDAQVRQMADDFARRIQSQGITVEQYFQFTGMNAEQLFAQMRPEALKRIQNSLVLEAIAKAEDIQISDERVEEELAKMAEAYKMELDKIKEMISDDTKEQIRKDLAVQAAVDLVRDAAKEV